MVIILGNQKGGVGKSELSYSLASFLAEDHKVILIDTDKQRTSSKRAFARSQLGGDMSFPVVEQSIVPVQTIKQLRTSYDVVVVDLPAGGYANIKDLAPIADLWICPTQASQPDLDSTVELAQAFDAMAHLHPSGRIPLSIVINKVSSASKSVEGEDAIAYFAHAIPNVPVLKTPIRDRKVWRDAHKSARTIFEMPPRERAKAVQEFDQFVADAMAAYSSFNSTTTVQ